MNFSQRLVQDEHGAPAIEYAMIAAIVGVAAVGAMFSLGNEVRTSYFDTQAKVDEENGAS